LAQEIGKADFLVALELAAEQHMYGVEYLRAIVTLPSVSAPNGSAQATSDPLAFSGPSQPEVERDLAQYECYVANRDSILQEEPVVQGGRA
jgi:hypothetical protein